MSVSFAGVPLPTPTPEVSDWVRRHLSLADVVEFSRLHWPTRGLTHLSFPGTAPDRPVQLGRLWWPRGAARFAVGHFLATDAELATIRQAVYTGTNTLLPATLKMTWDLPTGATFSEVQTSLYMLPPRPLAQIAGQSGLWLLTLVDDRYFWWFKSTNVLTIEEGTTTWADLYEDLGAALGVTITHDAVASAYLKPPRNLATHYEYTPLVLDAVAYNCGHRLVRRLDGTVHAINAATSKAVLHSGYSTTSTWPKIAGGRLALDPLVNPNDAPPQLPYGVQVTFPLQEDGALVNSSLALAVTLAELNLADIPGTTLRHAGYKLYHDTLVAARDTSTGLYDNQTELDALVRQIATDFYRHQLAPLDLHLAGIMPWVTEGLSDSVEWTHSGDDGLAPGEGLVSTRVQRPPFNDLTLELLHAGSEGSSDGGGEGSGKLITQELDGSPRTDPTTLFNINQDHWLTWTDNGGGSGTLGWSGFAIYHEGQSLQGPKRILEFIDGPGISSVVGTSGDHVTVTISAVGVGATLWVGELDGSPYTEPCEAIGINQDTYLTWTTSTATSGYISWRGFILHTGSAGLSGVGPHKTLHVESLGGITVAITEDVANDWNILYLSVTDYDTIKNNRKDFYYWRQIGTTPTPARYHVAGNITTNTLSTGAITGGVNYAMPLPTPRGGTIDRIGIGVTTPASAGNYARLMIYSSISETDLYPGNLELDCGTVAIDALAFVEATINFTFAHGKLYWLVVCPSANVSIQVLTGGIAYPLLGFDPSSAMPMTQGGGVGWRVTNAGVDADAAFPAGGTILVVNVGVVFPAIFVRFSA